MSAVATAEATAFPGELAHRGMITLSVMLATIIQAIDGTIANVALPHMEGSLSASEDQITWVLTSYIIAAAIMTPLSGWLSVRFGLKQVLLASIAGFTSPRCLWRGSESCPRSWLSACCRALRRRADPALAGGHAGHLSAGKPGR